MKVLEADKYIINKTVIWVWTAHCQVDNEQFSFYYEEIHIIDLRHFGNRLSNYLEENDFDNILIIYNFINLATDNNILRLKY